MAWQNVPFLNVLVKAIENIISLTAVASGSTTLSNGQDATFTITTTATSKARTLVAYDWSLYLGSVSTANHFPDGANITMSNWVIIPFSNDWGDTNNTNTVMQVYVRNVSAGASQTVVLEVQSRLLQNSTTLGGSS